ncbi:MAG: fimbrial assembly protein [Fusobacterium sp.]|nr:fimbrial assembly protein [Fusobacterium sp.]
MKNKYFKLSYLNKNFLDRKNKISILCLENYFFNSFIMEVDNIINEEDRIEKIEDRLEGIFTEYDSSKFLLKYEILEENKKTENLVVYLLNLDLLEQNSIIEDTNEKNIKEIKFISIIPSFLKCREFKSNPNFFNFDISKKNIVISKYTENILEDINFYKIREDEEFFEETYSNIINTYLESIDDKYSIVFTGEEINNNSLILENKDFCNFEIEEFDINKAPNFLPNNLKSIHTYIYNNTKYLLILLVLTLILLCSSIFLNYKISNLENIFVDIQVKNSNYEEEILSMREEMENIEKSKIDLQKELEKNKNNNLKLDFLLEFLSEISEDIKIKSIESDKNFIINIVGTSRENKNIIKFLKQIEESKFFDLVNYDYIMNIDKNNIFEFKAEVKYLF